MSWAIFKATTVNGSQTEVSDDILKVTGLKHAYTRTRRPILCHPTIKAVGPLWTKGHFLIFVFSGNTEFVVYIDEIVFDQETKTSTLKCWDILKKLDGYPAATFSSVWWSGYTPGTWQFNNGTTDNKDYICLPFLLRCLCSGVTGTDLSYLNTNWATWLSEGSPFAGNFSGSFGTYRNRELGFQWQQLLHMGKSDSTDEDWQGASLLDVYLFVCEILEVSFKIADYSTYIVYNVVQDYSYTAGTVLREYGQKRAKAYDALKMTSKELGTSTEFESAYEASDFTEEEAETSCGYPKTVFSINYDYGFYPCKVDIGNTLVYKMEYFSSDNFIDQIHALFEDRYIDELYLNTYEVEEVCPDESTGVPANNEHNIKERISKLTVLST